MVSTVDTDKWKIMIIIMTILAVKSHPVSILDQNLKKSHPIEKSRVTADYF